MSDQNKLPERLPKMLGITIDTETTHLEPSVGEIISLCMIIHDEAFEEIDRYITLIKPSKPFSIDPQAMLVNGIDPKELMKAPTAMQVRNSVFPWLEEYQREVTEGKGKGTLERYIPMGHNYPFDRGFLIPFFHPDKYKSFFHYDYRDSKVVAQFMMDSGSLPLGSTSLIHLTEKFDIIHKPHDSFGDTWATLQVYRRLINLNKQRKVE